MISISSSHRFTGLFVPAALNQSMSDRGNRKRLESKELRTGLLENVRMGECEQTIGPDVFGMRQVLEPLNGTDAGRDLNIEEPAPGTGAAHQHFEPPDRTKSWARTFGGLFLAGSAVHVALVSGWPHVYDSFADGSYCSFIEHAWRSALVPNVRVLIPLLAAFEAAVGFLTLARRARRIGIACAIGFSMALMLFGWGFWVWSLPVIGLLAYFWHLEESEEGGALAAPAHVHAGTP
jgi:hypothetical protein